MVINTPPLPPPQTQTPPRLRLPPQPQHLTRNPSFTKTAQLILPPPFQTTGPTLSRSLSPRPPNCRWRVNGLYPHRLSPFRRSGHGRWRTCMLPFPPPPPTKPFPLPHSSAFRQRGVGVSPETTFLQLLK